MKISIVGAGAFGTAIANSISNDNIINIFTHNKQTILNINVKRKNLDYFPNKILSKKIKATNNIEFVYSSDIIFLCIPSHTIVDFIRNNQINEDIILVNGAKGFGKDNLLIHEAINEISECKVISMKGPSFANEMIFEVPTAFTLAGGNITEASIISNVFRKDIVFFDYTSDINAVEILSIAKNIYSIIIGIIDASYNSSNVRFMIFTKAINEMKYLLKTFHLSEDSLFLYAGIGDFGLTSLNDLSRNRTLGLLLGKGFLGNNIESSIVLEGLKSVKNMIKLVPKNSFSHFPLLINLDLFLDGKLQIKDFLNSIINN